MTDCSVRRQSGTRPPISEVLSRVLPERGIVLEVGSGTGQHALQFARTMPDLIWARRANVTPDCLKSILAWLAVEEFPNVRPPVHLDVCACPGRSILAAALVCINLIHIAPWSATECPLVAAAHCRAAAASCVFYGPFQRQGRHTSPSNRSFDLLLRRQDPAWGVLGSPMTVSRLADGAGFDLLQSHEMPSNNLIVVFRKTRLGPD